MNIHESLLNSKLYHQYNSLNRYIVRIFTNIGDRRDTFIGQVRRYYLVPFRIPYFVVLLIEIEQQGVLCGNKDQFHAR